MSISAYSAKPSCKLDADIGNYILSSTSGDFSKIVATDDRWQVFYHLSAFPTGLLCWYPFRRHASVLQIGGGFGALTGLLCDRCDNVTVLERNAYRAECIKKRWNEKSELQVLNVDIADLPDHSSYDYIVLIVDSDSLAPVFGAYGYISILSRVKTQLSDGGKLLFAVSNRMGLQYLCGAPDASTGIPFDGPNDYPTGVAVPSLSRPELLDVLKQSGFPKVKLYYPFPDHLLPQLIYTDEYPPGKELCERLQPYQANQSSLVIDEYKIYSFWASNGQILPFANSFLAECGDGNASSVLFAAVSTERSREESFSTAIIDNDKVEKRPLYAEGIRGLERLDKNLNNLNSHGIPAISCSLEDNKLVMPRVFAPTLSDYLKDLVMHDSAGFIECMDKLYQCILQSSEHMPHEKNALAGLNPNADWGPILASAYIEMIPVNCFCDNGEFLFFDQEFVRQNYPAGYVMFRALNDVYWFAPQTEQYVPLRKMRERYGLTELWPAFLQEEKRFQDCLRQRKKYQHFYKLVLPDRKNIMRNGRLLLMDDKPERVHLKTPDRMFAAVDGAEGKQIVLFGAGKMMDHYINKYGAKYPPSFVVDNDESKWNTEKFGFAIRSPQALCKLTPGQYRVIICNGAYPEIADQLLKMSINDFRIYVRTFDELLDTVEINQNQNLNEKYNIGYVTGVFDLFHIGHLNILKKSKERCEYLIAGVLTDEICIREKGNKPFISFEERMEIVRHIDFVDRVVPVDAHNTDKFEAWKQLHFDCFFSGRDHEWYWLEKQLQSVGSNVEVFPYTQSTNSTELREFINKDLR